MINVKCQMFICKCHATKILNNYELQIMNYEKIDTIALPHAIVMHEAMR